MILKKLRVYRKKVEVRKVLTKKRTRKKEILKPQHNLKRLMIMIKHNKLLLLPRIQSSRTTRYKNLLKMIKRRRKKKLLQDQSLKTKYLMLQNTHKPFSYSEIFLRKLKAQTTTSTTSERIMTELTSTSKP